MVGERGSRPARGPGFASRSVAVGRTPAEGGGTGRPVPPASAWPWCAGCRSGVLVLDGDVPVAFDDGGQVDAEGGVLGIADRAAQLLPGRVDQDGAVAGVAAGDQV